MKRLAALTCMLGALGVATTSQATDVTVSTAKIGTTQKYSGMNVHPQLYTADVPAWLAEMGITWTRTLAHNLKSNSPFDGLTIEEVKANPDRLDWNAVDSYYGSDRTYLAWARDNGGIYTDGLVWQRNKESDPCGSAGVQVFTRGNATDENVYWVAMFAYAYWANVKNSLHMTHVEISNEPDNCGGNGAGIVNVDGQDRMIELAKDAISYVNGTLVSPPLPAFVFGPGLLSQWNGRAWLKGALTTATTAAALDAISFHAYYENHWMEEIGGGVDYIRSTAAGRTMPIWISEWGQFWTSYSTASDVQAIAATLPKFASMGVAAAALYELQYWSPFPEMGVVRKDGSKTRMYWDIKMLNRALSFEKDMLDTGLANAQDDALFAFATRDDKALNLIVLNNGTVADSVSIDLSAFPDTEGRAVAIYQVAGGSGPYAEAQGPAATVQGGRLTLNAEADTHYVAVIAGAGAPDAGRTNAPPDAGAQGKPDAAAPKGAGGGEGGASTREASSPATSATSGDPSPERVTDETGDAPASQGCAFARGPRTLPGAGLIVLFALGARCRRRRYINQCSASLGARLDDAHAFW